MNDWTNLGIRSATLVPRRALGLGPVAGGHELLKDNERRTCRLSQALDESANVFPRESAVARSDPREPNARDTLLLGNLDQLRHRLLDRGERRLGPPRLLSPEVEDRSIRC